MGGFPPSSGSNPPPPPYGGVPPQGGFPPAGGSGGPPPPGPPGAPGGPFGPPGAYAPPPGFGYGGMAKAGFGPRLGAYIIDGIIVGLFALPAYLALLTGDTKIETCSVDESGDIDFSGTVDNGLCEVPTGGTWAIFAVLLVLAIVAAVVYFGKLEGGSGQTVGKKALGIKVVDSRTGGPIGVGRGVGRYFARILSNFLCGLGYLWMLWDPEKQTWHDKIVNSYVVKA